MLTRVLLSITVAEKLKSCLFENVTMSCTDAAQLAIHRYRCRWTWRHRSSCPEREPSPPRSECSWHPWWWGADRRQWAGRGPPAGGGPWQTGGSCPASGGSCWCSACAYCCWYTGGRGEKKEAWNIWNFCTNSCSFAVISGFSVATYCSGPRRRSDAVVPHPLGVGLLHRGLLHVLAPGEDVFHGGQVVSTHRRQAHITPGRWGGCSKWREAGEEIKINEGVEIFCILLFHTTSSKWPTTER